MSHSPKSASFSNTAPRVTPTTSSEVASMPATKSLPIASKDVSETTPSTKGASKITRKKVDNDSELLSMPIDPGVLLRLRYISASRQNFATNIMRKLVTRAERETSNVSGVLGKQALDRDRVDYIKSVTFKMYPLQQNESEESAWAKCRGAIDEANRRLYRPK